MSNLNANYSEAKKLAEAIFGFIDLWGVDEIDAVVGVLTGDTSIEDFIEQVETDLEEQKG